MSSYKNGILIANFMTSITIKSVVILSTFHTILLFTHLFLPFLSAHRPLVRNNMILSATPQYLPVVHCCFTAFPAVQQFFSNPVKLRLLARWSATGRHGKLLVITLDLGEQVRTICNYSAMCRETQTSLFSYLHIEYLTKIV